jgi:hypothetical protein
LQKPAVIAEARAEAELNTQVEPRVEAAIESTWQAKAKK